MKLQYRIILFLIISIWFAGIFFNWIIHIDNNLIIAYPFVHKIYSIVCHQQNEKLLHFGFGNSLVCARCSGIYAGILLSSFIFIFYTLKKIPDIKYLVLFSLPMIFDVILYSAGLYHYSKTAAFVTGLLFGSVGFLYLYRGINLFIAHENN